MHDDTKNYRPLAHKQFSVQCLCNVDVWGNHVELEILGLLSSNVARSRKEKETTHTKF